MSSGHNVDPGAGTEFHPKGPHDQHSQHGGHQPGKLLGKDAVPEFHAETLPAGSAPPSKTFEPNTDSTGNNSSESTHTSKLVDDVLAEKTSANTESNVAPAGSSSTSAKDTLPELHKGDAISPANSTRPGTENAIPIGSSKSATAISAHDSAALSESKQDDILSATDAARPGDSDATPVGVSLSDSSAAHDSSALPESKQDDILSATDAARPGATDATPAGISQSAGGMSQSDSSTALPESKQDDILSATDAARPGDSDAAPAGISQSSSSVSGDQALSENVKSSLDSISGPPPITQQLPTASEAADAVKSGVASLISGVQSLAFGANDAVAKNASDSHAESSNARGVDDLHVPGEFNSETTDAEDKSAVQRGLQSAQNSLPSTEDVKSSLQSAQASLPGSEDVKRSVSVAETNMAYRLELC